MKTIVDCQFGNDKTIQEMILWLEHNIGPQTFLSVNYDTDKESDTFGQVTSMPITTAGTGWKIDSFIVANGKMSIRNEVIIDDETLATMFHLVSKQWQ